jgi:hypothetical protein
MRAVSGGWHSPNLQTIKERKQTTSKTRTAAAGGALCTNCTKPQKAMKSQENEVIEKILKKINQKVIFKYPGEEPDKIGILKDRFVFTSIENNGVPYWDVIDLIEFPDEEVEKEWMRISYYRKAKERLVWGGQTSITEPLSIWKTMLTKVISEKTWFKELLEESLKKSNIT